MEFTSGRQPGVALPTCPAEMVRVFDKHSELVLGPTYGFTTHVLSIVASLRTATILSDHACLVIWSELTMCQLAHMNSPCCQLHPYESRYGFFLLPSCCVGDLMSDWRLKGKESCFASGLAQVMSSIKAYASMTMVTVVVPGM